MSVPYRDDDKLCWHDMAHLMLTSETSFEALKRTLPSPKADTIEIECFRSNIIVGGSAAYAEDTWDEVVINNVHLVTPLYSWRCRAVTIDQNTYEADPDFEPVRTLRQNRVF